MNPTAISISYDHFAFEQNDIDELYDELSGLAPTRKRIAYIERGGDETSLWIVATFVGLAFVGGIIEHIAGHAFDAVVSKLRTFYARRRSAEPRYGQAVAFRLSFDDLDIEINLPGETRADFIEPLVMRIHQHITGGAFGDSPVSMVKVPFVQDLHDRKWRQTFVWSESDFPDRYWGISFHGMPRITSIYDSHQRTTVTAEWDDIEE